MKENNLYLTGEQLMKVKEQIQACCSYIEYQGQPRPHVNTVLSHVKRIYNIKKIEHIPATSFYEVLQSINSYKYNTPSN